MKKSIFLICALLSLTACNFMKPVDGPGMERDVDSLDVEEDSLARSNEIEVAPEDKWTDEYIASWVGQVYEKVNEVWSRQEVHQVELDTAFFAKSYLDLKAEVFRIQEGKSFDDLFFVEYMPFSQGLQVPIKVSNVKPNLLTGNIAEVTFDISDSNGDKVSMWWHLDFANDQWRIDDYKNDPADEKGLSTLMDEYVQKNKKNSLDQYAE